MFSNYNIPSKANKRKDLKILYLSYIKTRFACQYILHVLVLVLGLDADATPELTL